MGGDAETSPGMNSTELSVKSQSLMTEDCVPFTHKSYTLGNGKFQNAVEAGVT